MNMRVVVIVASLVAELLCAQERTESAQSAAEGVLNGGTFSEAVWRRSDDGMLEVDFSGTPTAPRFVKLLGSDLGEAILNCGAMGMLSMGLQGGSDLLGMTDAEYHLHCLGIDTTDAGLRAWLSTPLPKVDGALARASELDRMLAIDLLSRHAGRTAITDLAAIAADDHQGGAIRERASDACARLGDEKGVRIQRHHLDPKTMLLPAAFDVAVIIDHDRLPDMSWMTGFGRRIGMRVSAHTILSSQGDITQGDLGAVQRLSDSVCELPFGIVLAFGKARFDQTCCTITVRPGERLPFTAGWNIAGSFEAERWRDSPGLLGRFQPPEFAKASFAITADTLTAATDGTVGIPRPQLAGKLLADTGASIRAVVPVNSKVLPMLAMVGMPMASGADLRLTFGAVARLELSVTTSDEDGAAAWVDKAKELLKQGRAMVVSALEPQLRSSTELRALVDLLLDPKLEQEGNAVTATVEFKDFDRNKLMALVAKLTS